jgi:hypothetical protein
MREVLMGVRPQCLETSEGELISISIAVQPRDLESLLDALALLDFPINPGIYHDAAIVTRFADGREEVEATTLVEFPAYPGWLEAVRRAVTARGFEAGCIQVTDMLEDLQTEDHPQSVTLGIDSISRYRVRRSGAGG